LDRHKDWKSDKINNLSIFAEEIRTLKIFNNQNLCLDKQAEEQIILRSMLLKFLRKYLTKDQLLKAGLQQISVVLSSMHQV